MFALICRKVFIKSLFIKQSVTELYTFLSRTELLVRSCLIIWFFLCLFRINIQQLLLFSTFIKMPTVVLIPLLATYTSEQVVSLITDGVGAARYTVQVVLLSALLNGEPLFEWNYLAALLLVCIGIYLVNRAPQEKQA